MINTKLLKESGSVNLPLDEQASMVSIFVSMYHAYKSNDELCMRDFGATTEEVIDHLYKSFPSATTYMQNVTIKAFAMMVLYDGYPSAKFRRFLESSRKTYVHKITREVIDKTLNVLDRA